MNKKYGDWVCVIGAAEGLGRAFASELAKQNYQLLLIDKDQTKLAETETFLRNTFGVRVDALLLDLNAQNSVALVLEAINNNQIRLLVYNAAYGPVKPFLANTAKELDLYVNVNISFMIHLIQSLIKSNQEQPIGILLLSSLAGWRGTRFVVPYAASKAFIWNFAEGLHYEFRGKKVDISVCVAGATDTPNFRSTRPRMHWLMPKPMDPQKVAYKSIKNLGKQLFIFPSAGIMLIHFLLNRVLPRSWASSIHNNAMQRMYGHQFKD